jgi:hypothetical protein
VTLVTLDGGKGCAQNLKAVSSHRTPKKSQGKYSTIHVVDGSAALEGGRGTPHAPGPKRFVPPNHSRK